MIAIQDPSAAPGGALQQLRDAMVSADYLSALMLVGYLIAGGLLAAYVRMLYRRTSRNPSADSVARSFPLLTCATIAVISVVKSSMALSLGLVGALSIVRFRTAVKDSEELVYLFLCIGIGLALGAGQPLIAIALLVAASLFVLVFERIGGDGHTPEAFVTVTGPAHRFVSDGPDAALTVVNASCANVIVQRCDLDGDEGQLRVQVRAARDADAGAILQQLREGLPDCQISYVDAGVFS